MDDPRARVLDLLKRHGADATSFQTLGSGFRYAFFGDDACVAYVDTGGAWVAAGAPFAAAERFADVSAAFVREASAHRRRAVFFAADERFAAAVPALGTLVIGEQAAWDPRAWPETLRRVRSVREQIRRARAKGVRVTRCADGALATGSALRSAADRLARRWLRTRPMAPMGFLVQVEPFSFAAERRYYVAQVGGALVGLLAMAPVYARGGWFLENLLRDPSAPNGTPEALFDAAMRDLAAEGIPYATLGLAPLAGAVGPWLRRARALGRPLYDFSGLQSFKQKLRPASWAPMLVAFPRGAHPAVAIADVLVAFARRSLVRFGLATVFRGPDIVVRAMTVALVPWTVALASVDAAVWFPSRAIRDAWVVFDVVLAIALIALAVRWRRWLATALAVAITLDALITLGEALVFNAAHLRGAGDVAPLVVAVLAPTFSAVVVWSARARLVSMHPPRATRGAPLTSR
jgi:phosphatidylglycerol lysyltransferase